MPITRRAFVRGFGGGALAMPLVMGRGFEAEAGRDGTPGIRPDGLIRLDSNENPNGPSREALRAITTALSETGRYPRGLERRLVDRIEAHHRVGSGAVLLGCGATELLQVAVDAFASRGRWLTTASPSFETPANYATTRGIPVVGVPLGADLGLDLDGMLARSVGAGLVYVCNPNNPTGTVHSRADVEEFIRRVIAKSPSAQVLVDEAYFDYVEHPGHGSLIPMALAEPRVVVLRTFSKVHGMAGLRVGYAVGRRDSIAAMRRFRLRLSVNVLGAAAATAALGDARHVARERARNEEARTLARTFFEGAGLQCAKSQTNFLMVGLRRPIEPFQAACAARGVAVGRPFPPLLEHARISIGTIGEMKLAMKVFADVLRI